MIVPALREQVAEQIVLVYAVAHRQNARLGRVSYPSRDRGVKKVVDPSAFNIRFGVTDV
jgi:hypothetical protein